MLPIMSNNWILFPPYGEGLNTQEIPKLERFVPSLRGGIELLNRKKVQTKEFPPYGEGLNNPPR